MIPTKRTLLVVEDDQVLNTLYKIHCEEVLKELPHVQGTVAQAFSFSQAQQILASRPVDFISVDIALSKEEEGKTDEEREEKDAGGMALLRQLQRTQRQPLTVIVTGETLLSYAIDAYRKYGVLAFYQKARFNNQEYKDAIKAALWYLDAAELVEKPRIAAALQSWHNALAAAKLAGIKEQQFPEAIGQKIQTGWTHPITGLPIGHWTEEKLRSNVVEQEDWTLIRVTISGFDRFIATYASQEEPILSFTSRLLKQVEERFNLQKYFVGQLGHREFMSEPVYVILLNRQDEAQASQITGWLKEEFANRDKIFTPAFRNKANLLETPLALETKILTGSEDTFEDLHRLLDILGSTRA